MKKKKRPERPIDVSKLINEYAEEGRLPLSFGGTYLPKSHDGSGGIAGDLKAISPIRKPACEKAKKDENVRER